jgi:hypothetical protein
MCEMRQRLVWIGDALEPIDQYRFQPKENLPGSRRTIPWARPSMI